MPAVDNIIIVIDGITYDAQEIMRKIVIKYGENPIISDYAKNTLADYEKRKLKRATTID